jgi:hypothetical protein
MGATALDRSKLPGRHVTEGTSSALRGASSLDLTVRRRRQDAVERVFLELESRGAAAGRRKAWKRPPNPYQRGALRKYADQVGAGEGTVTHPGKAKEVICDADI